MEVDEAIDLTGLDAPVDIVLDQWETPHVYATSQRDAWTAVGFITARHRFGQLEVARRAASGTLAEISGDELPDAWLADFMVQLLGVRRAAEESWELVSPDDPEGQALLGFAQGVNAYIERARQGEEEIPEAHLQLLESTDLPWSPVDSIAVARLESLRRSWIAIDELDLHLLIQQSQETFTAESRDHDMRTRAGYSEDMARFDPSVHTLTPHGPPISNSSNAIPGALSRAHLDPEIAAGWRAALDALSRRLPSDRSSLAWAATGRLSQSGGGLIAATLGGPMIAPSPHYAVHLTVENEEQTLEVAGLLAIGTPIIRAGFNRHLAWIASPSRADLIDLSLEEIVEIDDDTLGVRRSADGVIPLETSTLQASAPSGMVELAAAHIPGHGPLIPARVGDGLLDSYEDVALSLRWTGGTARRDIVPFTHLMTSRSLRDATTALANHPVDDLSFLVVDSSGAAASLLPWCLPQRDSRTLRRYWSRPDRSPPATVGVGLGQLEWSDCQGVEEISRWTARGDGDSRLFITAGADPSGATHENEPFYEGWPYSGWSYEPGFRTSRLEEVLMASNPTTRLTLDDAIESLTDDSSPLFAQLIEPLSNAMERAQREREDTGSEQDLTYFVNQVGEQFLLLEQAVEYLEDWDFTFPARVYTRDEEDSVAATIAAVWLSRLFRNIVADELEVLGVALNEDMALKALVRLFATDQRLRTMSPTLGHSTLFDDLTTDSRFETRDERLLRSLDQAISRLDDHFGSEMSEWRWDELHRANLTGLPLENGGSSDATIGIAGGPWSLWGCQPSLTSREMDCSSEGPMSRFVVETTPWGPRGQVVLAGSQEGNPESETYNQELELWATGGSRPLPFNAEDVLELAERRIQLNPTDQGRP